MAIKATLEVMLKDLQFRKEKGEEDINLLDGMIEDITEELESHKYDDCVPCTTDVYYVLHEEPFVQSLKDTYPTKEQAYDVAEWYKSMPNYDNILVVPHDYEREE